MKVPGSLKLRNGRYSYKVTYPGDSKPTVKALKIPGQKFATNDIKVAEQLAAIMYQKHISENSEDVFDGTIEDLCRLYLQDAKDYHTDNDGKVAEYYHTKVYSLALLRKLHGNTMAASFGPKALKDFRKQMICLKELDDLQKEINNQSITKPKQKKLQAEYNKLKKSISIKDEFRPVCRREINRRITVIKNMWKWGVSEELLPNDAYHAMQTVTGIREGTRGTYDLPPVKPVDHEIVEFTLEFCTKVQVDMITIHELTGMRPAELCNMRPCEIDRTVDPWLYEPTKHKMKYKGKDRKIYFGPVAQKILRPYLLRDQDQYCFSPRESEQQRLAKKHAERTTPIHLGNKPGTNRVENPKRSAGVKYNPRSYNKAISRAIERARKVKPELPKWFPYQLRHSLGTKMRKEYGIEAASACLGNDLEAAKIYAERDENIAIAAAKKFG